MGYQDASSLFDKHIQRFRDRAGLYAPGVSEVIGFDVGASVGAGAMFSTSGDGGAGLVSLADAGGAWSYGTQCAQISNPSTQPWAFYMRGIIPTPVAGNTGQIGLVYPGGTQMATFGHNYAGSATQAWLASYRGSYIHAYGWTIDPANIHDFVMAFDKTTLKLYVDDVLRATITDLSQMPTGACRIAAAVKVTALKVNKLALARVAI